MIPVSYFGKISDRVEKVVNIVKGKEKTEGPEIKHGIKE
jgi:hypothetical protein